jgi:hypothetical protein
MTYDPPVAPGGKPAVGFGQALMAPTTMAATATSPWLFALATSAMGAATGWVIEEVAKKVRGKKRRR